MSDIESPQADDTVGDSVYADLYLMGRITYNEIHSSLIGISFGFISSLIFLYVYPSIGVLFLSMVAITPTLYPKLFDPSAAIYTIQSEPWYYLTCIFICWILTFIIYEVHIF